MSEYSTFQRYIRIVLLYSYSKFVHVAGLGRSSSLVVSVESSHYAYIVIWRKNLPQLQSRSFSANMHQLKKPQEAFERPLEL